jgi:putative ABC transport system substrate-binding protein
VPSAALVRILTLHYASSMKRREFISLLGGASAWPLAARAQQNERLRHIGILIGGSDNAEARLRVDAFLTALKQLDWTDGQNVRIDLRWGGSNRNAELARELVQLKPDVIVAAPTNAFVPVQKETHTIPIVFVQVSDPVGQGFVQSLARPTGNATGFSNLEFSLIGKWLQLLKEASPGIKRVGLMISISNASSPRWYRAFSETAPSFAVEPIAAALPSPANIEAIVKSVASTPNSALIVAGDSVVNAPVARRQIVELTAAHGLPALYGWLPFAADGGLIAYGIDYLDQYRHAASYVDRILKGEKPSDLPVQQPTKFRFVINLKTAKALGLDLSPTFVGTADEVIE